MAREIANNLAAAYRVADQRDPLQIEVGEQSRQIISQRVELIARAGIIRAAVTAPVIGDAAQALIGERYHLILPHRSRKRPGADEDRRAPCAPVPVIQAGMIVGFKEWHRILSPFYAVACPASVFSPDSSLACGSWLRRHSGESALKTTCDLSENSSSARAEAVLGAGRSSAMIMLSMSLNWMAKPGLASGVVAA